MVDLQKINKGLKTTPIKGKDYVMVKDRVAAFRANFDGWRLITDMLAEGPDYVIFLATVFNQDGAAIATGHAKEVVGSNKINQTSALENCETSAMGRALANLGIGIDDSFASANEVDSAIAQQQAIEAQYAAEAAQPITDAMYTKIAALCDQKGVYEDVMRQFNLQDLHQMTRAQYSECVRWLGNV